MKNFIVDFEVDYRVIVQVDFEVNFNWKNLGVLENFNFVVDFIVIINFIVDLEVSYSSVDLVADCGVDFGRNALHFGDNSSRTKLAN